MEDIRQETIDVTNAAEADYNAIGSVHYQVFPQKPEKPLAYRQQQAKQALQGAAVGDLRPQASVIRVDGRIVAAALGLPKRITTPRGELVVLGLAGVSSLEEFRGRGFGAQVVRAVFERVDQGLFPLSLFQTGVADFYKKLGCREVDNPFVDSTSEVPNAQPWWNPHIMVYPADADWPEGEIDLMGPGW